MVFKVGLKVKGYIFFYYVLKIVAAVKVFSGAFFLLSFSSESMRRDFFYIFNWFLTGT